MKSESALSRLDHPFSIGLILKECLNTSGDRHLDEIKVMHSHLESLKKL